MNIIDKAIFVVINSIVGDFVFVYPHDVFQIFVIVVNTRINYSYNNGF